MLSLLRIMQQWEVKSVRVILIARHVPKIVYVAVVYRRDFQFVLQELPAREIVYITMVIAVVLKHVIPAKNFVFLMARADPADQRAALMEAVLEILIFVNLPLILIVFLPAVIVNRADLWVLVLRMYVLRIIAV